MMCNLTIRKLLLFVLGATAVYAQTNNAPKPKTFFPYEVHEKVLPNKLSNYPLTAGDVVSMRTAGGGGFGDPLKRYPKKIDRDSREGKCLPKEK